MSDTQRDDSGRVRRAHRGRQVNGVRTIKAWVGYADGEPYVYINDYGQREWCVFVNRADARRAFSDIRRVTLTIQETP